MKLFGTKRLTLELRWRDWAYRKLRIRSGLPNSPVKPHPSIQEHLFYSAILKEALTESERQTLSHWIDVGCRNWGYLPGCLSALPTLESGVGIERDPGRIYWNGYYRGDYAEAAALQSSTPTRTLHFVPGNFQSLTPTLGWSLDSKPGSRSRLITHFFPFVSERPCTQWGLPIEYSNFTPLASHTLNLLSAKMQGDPIDHYWLSLHQGEWEADIAREVWTGLGCSFTEKKLDPISLPGNWPSRHPLYLLVGRVKKT